MARPCSVCAHPQRKEIDRMLLSGSDSFRRIAKRFDLTEAAVGRHNKNGHIPKRIAKSQEVKDAVEAKTILEQIEGLLTEALDILEKSKTNGKFGHATSAIREARGCLELLGKLSGELNDGTKINVLVNPSWISVKGIIVEALGPYPDAREAVAKALELHSGS